jgi:hypothetical protein
MSILLSVLLVPVLVIGAAWALLWIALRIAGLDSHE